MPLPHYDLHEVTVLMKAGDFRMARTSARFMIEEVISPEFSAEAFAVDVVCALTMGDCIGSRSLNGVIFDEYVIRLSDELTARYELMPIERRWYVKLSIERIGGHHVFLISLHRPRPGAR